MNQHEDPSRMVRPNYTLAALMLIGLGYYIAFEIAEEPGTPNVMLLKILGIGNMVIFSLAVIYFIKQAFRK